MFYTSILDPNLVVLYATKPRTLILASSEDMCKLKPQANDIARDAHMDKVYDILDIAEVRLIIVDEVPQHFISEVWPDEQVLIFDRIKVPSVLYIDMASNGYVEFGEQGEQDTLNFNTVDWSDGNLSIWIELE